ncbi:MAG TPA: metallophosphoesterase family protein [Gaiellaceae bacterium]|jgi:putative phosphoesterase|nr:metallophosphoesterase family protein [Gaiellaceae bacterium]
MRIAVVSDTHLPRGTRVLPAPCVERLRSADLIVHAGDLVSAAFLRELRAFGPPVVAVAGNVDEPAVRAALPERIELDAGGARLGVVHDAGPRAGREGRLVAAFPGCAAVVYGHSHLPQVERHEGVWILNPGSPTERRRAPTRSMIDLEVEGGELRPVLVDLGTREDT